MGIRTNPAKKSVRNLAIIASSVLTFIILFAVVATLAASNKEDNTDQSLSSNNSQGQAVTETTSLDEYLNAHTILLNLDPTTSDSNAISVRTPDGGGPVEWSGTVMQSGHPGETVDYTLTLINNTLSDETYDITSSSYWPLVLSGDVFTVTAGGNVEVVASVTISPNVSNLETSITVITATAQSDPGIFNTVNLTTTAVYPNIFFPFITQPLDDPMLSATRPNSQNDWSMQWDSVDNATTYELQESQDPTFATGVTTYNLGQSATSQLINSHQPSPDNVFFYRIKASTGNVESPWSNVVRVVGAYFDDFSSRDDGWAIRRTTFLEEVRMWHEPLTNNPTMLIMQVEDSWDWGIASPLKPAPEVPYVIEFRSEPANLGNLVSHGVVFGGDWNGQDCPDYSSLAGIYQHNRCFNHFYNTNLIWSSDTDLKMLWERVDNLVWCPNCGGSPMKRLGDLTRIVELDGHGDWASGWNDYRIEVRENEIKFFFNGNQRFTYNDTRWVHGPYFGVFASADEYSNSTWRYEYFRITPLDN